MKSKTSTTYSYVTIIEMTRVLNSSHHDSLGRVQEGLYENRAKIYNHNPEDIVGGYLFFDGKYYGPIRFVEDGSHIVTDVKLPREMDDQLVTIYEKQSVTTTTYPPFYHKAKKGQSLYVKKNGAIGNEPDVYVKTGGTIKKLY